MTEPTYSPTTERLYSELPEVLRLADAKYGYALKHFLSGPGDVFGEVEKILARIEYIPEEDRADVVDEYFHENFIPLTRYEWSGEVDNSTSTSISNDGVELVNLAKNPSFESGTEFVTIAKNLHTNPSFEDGNVDVELLRNYATNPSFEAVNGTSEVMRNLAVNAGGAVASNNALGACPSHWPGTGNTALIYSGSDASWSLSGKCRRIVWDTATGTYGTVQIAGWKTAIGSTTGIYTGRIRYKTDTTHFDQTYASLSDFGSGVSMTSWGREQSTDGTWVAWITINVTDVSTILSAARTDMARLTSAVGKYVEISELDVYQGEYQPNRAWFDGQRSPDPDLTASYVGEAHLTPSILSGLRVSGTNDFAGCRSVASSDWATSGTRSVRIIPIYTTNNPLNTPVRATLLPAAQWAGKDITIVGRIRLKEAQKGPLTARARSILVDASNGSTYWSFYGEPAPNEPGEYIVRCTGRINPGTTNPIPVYLYNGAGVGGGDVWWDDLTIVEGIWPDLMPFSGRLPYEDPDFTTSWTGSPDTSETTVVGKSVTTVSSGNRGRNVKSTTWANSGQYSLRCIPTTPEDGTATNRDTFCSPGGDTGGLRMSMVAGRTYTAAVVVHIETPQKGLLHGDARRIVAYWKSPTGNYINAKSDPVPNVPGTYTISFSFTIPSDASEAFIRLYNGATAGNGDIWFDDFTLTDSAHRQLKPFHGDLPWDDVDFTTVWEGAQNNSTSLVRGVVPTGTRTQSGTSAAVMSTKWSATGKNSVRVIPLSRSSNNSWAGPMGDAVMMAGVEPGKTYTIAVIRRLEKKLVDVNGNPIVSGGTITLNREGWAMFHSLPTPNVPGEYLARTIFTVPDNATMAYVRLQNGALLGDGDVWWDDFTLVEGAWPELMPFSGHTKDLTSQELVDHSTSDLIDARYADPEWLDWIAQILGAQVGSISSEIGIRDRLNDASAGLYAGTDESIIGAVKAVLTGNKSVTLRKNRTLTGAGTVWDLLIITVDSETPVGFDFQKYLTEQGVKPAGVIVRQSTYAATWEVLELHRPIWANWNGKTWQEIMETGI